MSDALDFTEKTLLPFPSSTEEANTSLGCCNDGYNSKTDPAAVDRIRRPAIDAGPSVQRISKVYSSTAEAIANFKPTPKQIISGIAPHVFDERKRRRSHGSNSRRTSKAYLYSSSTEKRSSPLRGATVIAWDEHSIYLEQPPEDHKSSSSTNSATGSAKEISTKPHSRNPECPGQEDRQQRATLINSRCVKSDKAGWKYFRVDVHLLKTIIVKLKLTSSTTSIARKSKPSTASPK